MKQPYDRTSTAIAIACPRCEEPAGAYCRTPANDISPWTHRARQSALAQLERDAAAVL